MKSTGTYTVCCNWAVQIHWRQLSPLSNIGPVYSASWAVAVRHIHTLVFTVILRMLILQMVKMFSLEINKGCTWIWQYSENRKTSNKDRHLKLHQLNAELEAAKVKYGSQLSASWTPASIRVSQKDLAAKSICLCMAETMGSSSTEISEDQGLYLWLRRCLLGLNIHQCCQSMKAGIQDPQPVNRYWSYGLPSGVLTVLLKSASMSLSKK